MQLIYVICASLIVYITNSINKSNKLLTSVVRYWNNGA